MRPFEIIYIILVGWGAIQIFYKAKKRLNTRLLYKVTFCVFLIHIFIEQYRWQMIPGYMLGILLLIVYKKNIPPLGKFLITILVVLSFSLPSLIPVISMPKPTGKHKIGTSIHHWIDQEREEWFTDDPNDFRQIMIQLWYPAKLGEKNKRAPYLDRIDLRAETMAKAGGFPKFLIQHLELTKTNSYLNLFIENNATPMPIVIVSHGITGTRHIHTALAERLASHGYLVVGVDHSYDANLTIFPDGSSANYRSEITGHADSVRIREKQINTRTADISFIIDQLYDIQSGKIKHLANGYLDLNSIGVAGHSYGGGTSTFAAHKDARIKSVLILDAWLNPLPKNIIYNGIDQPILYMGRPNWDDSDYPSNNTLVDTLMKNTRGPNHHITIKETRHLNYCDAPLFSPLVKHILEVGDMNRPESVNLINQLSLEFFDQYLRQEKSKILNNLQLYPNITVH